MKILANNDPDYLSTRFTFAVQSGMPLSHWLGGQLESMIYDTLLNAKAACERDNPDAKQLMEMSYDGFPHDDEAYFDAAMEICAECWLRADAYNTLLPATVRRQYSSVDEHNYAADIVHGIVYVMLAAQSCLPNSAIRLVNYIEQRQMNDKYFFPAFQDLARFFVENDISDDTDFLYILIPNPDKKPEYKLDIESIRYNTSKLLASEYKLEYLKDCQQRMENRHFNIDQNYKVYEYVEEYIKKVEEMETGLYFYHYFQPRTPDMFDFTITESNSSEPSIASAKNDLISVGELLKKSAEVLNIQSQRILVSALKSMFANRENIMEVLDARLDVINSMAPDNLDIPDKNGRTVRLVVRLVDRLFKALKISQNADLTKLAAVYSHITGYTFDTIYNRFGEIDSNKSRDEKELKIIEKMLKDLNCDISMK